MVPLSNSQMRNRRGPVLLRACADSLPALVMPVVEVIGLGSISCRSVSSPRHDSRDRVSNSELDLPQQSNGFPGNKWSMISSVCWWLSSNLTLDASHKSTSPSPSRTTASRCSLFTVGHAEVDCLVPALP